jgi:hypothetical protein
MTETQAEEYERLLDARDAEKRRAEEEAFEARGSVPPRQSRVNGPPLDWRRWCATLDGFPVDHCFAFDVDEGWVEVYVVALRQVPNGRAIRTLDMPRRRLHGRVEAVTVEHWADLRKVLQPIMLTADRLRGDPVPGTEMRKR